ncbi:MOSC and FAD-binding oxidoreductase domain-containing protein [Streptacidiphilus fuscans]|uniref:MOSC domain-containing protein n=1 Tax=Streptacidiphilus fuscans TaxID=2789292 RepID=A0A931B144_9ACTN|nr:MOSC and FAD-binding oxidoreductase domain-containing protein [Streptacidiphilus fuscans]MBF9067237.1 MOSC domain-containing protein [Streptacidiphilus fuscans]
MGTLLSVNVGLPADVTWQGRTVRTGVWKSPVQGPRRVRRLNVEGDGQGDLAGHGGEIRAVLVYQAQSYAYWARTLDRDDLRPGMFGENFTVDGLPDDQVCIGDRYRIGEAEFEVTQPRVTCYRVGMRLGRPDMAALLVSHHRPGFYLRVLVEGRVQAGDGIELLAQGPEKMTVAEVDALLYLPGRDADSLRRVLNIPALSPGWRQSFKELLEPPRPARPTGWPGFRPLRVAVVVPETPTVCSIHFEDPDGGPLPAAQAGQFLSVRVRPGNGPAAVRSYSLSSAPGADAYRISVKRERHGLVSGYLHTRLGAGDVVDIASPRGSFVLEVGTRPVVLVSAGIGVTPVLAMLHQLAAVQDSRPVFWIHTTRDRGHHAFADEAHALLQQLPNAHEHVYYTAGEAAAGLVAAPKVSQGRLTLASLADIGVPTEADAYLCGPAGFMGDVTEHLTALGLAPERIHRELFSALPPVNPGVTAQAALRPHQPAGPPGDGPLVTFGRSGISAPWPEGEGSLLTLAEACDIPTRWSCRTGVCHTCVTPLVSGEVAYVTEPLEAPEPGNVLVCCSRPATEVVLDL